MSAVTPVRPVGDLLSFPFSRRLITLFQSLAGGPFHGPFLLSCLPYIGSVQTWSIFFRTFRIRWWWSMLGNQVTREFLTSETARAATVRFAASVLTWFVLNGQKMRKDDDVNGALFSLCVTNKKTSRTQQKNVANPLLLAAFVFVRVRDKKSSCLTPKTKGMFYGSRWHLREIC